MKYIIQENFLFKNTEKNAGSKARNDVFKILSDDYVELKLNNTMIHSKNDSTIKKLVIHKNIEKTWITATKILKKDDILFIQIPCLNHFIYLSSVVKKLKRKGIKIILLIHDIELLRLYNENDINFLQKKRIELEEKNVLLCADFIVAHNENMKRQLANFGIDEHKIVCLEIFDYLIPNFSEKQLLSDQSRKSSPVIIAGNLIRKKAGYLYKLPSDLYVNLYGVGYEGVINDKITYKGAFAPDDLPFVLDGSFGLVWDGDSTETCSGIYGNYLKINNPHKTSLYLASGIPVIIWDKAALAPFIKNNNCGITVGSLTEIKSKISELTDEQYSEMKESAKLIGYKIRAGHYLKKALKKINRF